MYALNRESAVEQYISRISRQKSQAFLPESTKYANLAIIWHPQPSPKLGSQPSPKKSSKQKGPEGPFVIVLVDISNKKRLALFDRLVDASFHARLVCGADNALATYQFLEAVGGPTSHTRAGKQRSNHILRNAHHGVH